MMTWIIIGEVAVLTALFAAVSWIVYLNIQLAQVAAMCV